MFGLARVPPRRRLRRLGASFGGAGDPTRDADRAHERDDDSVIVREFEQEEDGGERHAAYAREDARHAHERVRLRGRDGNALQRERHERRSVRRAQRGAHEQRRGVHASHQTSLATQTGGEELHHDEFEQERGRVRDPERASLGAEHAVDVVEPLVGHLGEE